MRFVHQSFGGRYSDSPRALYERLRQLERDAAAASSSGEHEHVWLADPAHRHGFPEGVATVTADGPQAGRSAGGRRRAGGQHPHRA